MNWNTMSVADKRELLKGAAALIVMAVAAAILVAIIVAAIVYAPWFIKPIFIALALALVLAIASTFYSD